MSSRTKHCRAALQRAPLALSISAALLLAGALPRVAAAQQAEELDADQRKAKELEALVVTATRRA